MAKLLNLPDTARSIVYEAVVSTLKADPVLSGLNRRISWMTYLGETAHQLPYENKALPAIEVVPLKLHATPEAQVLQNSPFGIRLIVTTAGLDVRDLLNLWGAVESALFPGDGSKTLGNNIRAALKARSDALGRPIGTFQTLNLMEPAVWGGADTTGTLLMTADGFLVAQMTVPK